MTVALDPGEDVAKAVEAGLTASSAGIDGTRDQFPVQVAVRDDSRAILGGLVGRVWMQELYVNLIWMDASLRGRGHGKAMMALAEAEGRKLGAKRSWLHTLSWQARPFYEALGYHCFAEMPLGDGHHRYFMRKDL